MALKIHVGTSGWNYDSFKTILYPPSLPKSHYFKEYVRHFDTVELNASFYRSFPMKTWEGWYKKSPDGFLWSVKASRFITHIRRLRVEDESIERLWEHVQILREKLGPILFQLPPNLAFDPEIVRDFFRSLRSICNGVRIALEARHPSWHFQGVLDLLRDFDIGWVVSHTGDRYPMTVAATSDFSYFRLHGPERLYHGLYGQKNLEYWLSVVKGIGKEAFFYFDNTDDGAAARDALLFKEMATAIL